MPGEERGALTAAAVLGAAILFTLGAIRAAGPPDPLPASAPAELFAAGRAQRHVEALAVAPRVPGTQEHARARSLLVAELERMGLEPSLQSGTMVRPFGAGWRAAKLVNVLARIPGAGSSGAVLLAAHYDSRPQTLGAGDDAGGVATLLETARAVLAGPRLANDVILLATDGEELGLLGAELFVAEHPWAEEVAVALNFEGRGSRGPVTMFEVTPGNRGLIEALASVPHPVASSLSYEVYRRMPNDTDLSAFRRAGLPGMNFAFVGRHPAYHTWLDRPDALSRATLQHLGSYALALTRELGNARLPLPAAGNAVYFNVLGHRLVRYPESLGGLWVALAGALALAALAVGLRRRRVAARGVLAGLAVLVTVAGGGWAVGRLLWHLVGRFAPDLLAAPHGLPYPSAALGAAGLLGVAAVAAALAGLWGGCRRPAERALGLAIGWIALAAATLFVAPGAGFFFVWPGAGLAAGALAALVVGGTRRRELAILGLGALPTLAIVGAALPFFWQALTARAGAAVGVVAALALTPLLPHLAELQRATRGRLGWLLAAAAVALLVGSSAAFEFDARTPRVADLLFVDDRDGGTAAWWSPQSRADGWTGRVLDGGEKAPPPSPLSTSSRSWLTAPASPTELPPPEIRVLDERRAGEERTLEVLVSSRRGAPVLRLHAESSISIRLLAVGERQVTEAGEGEIDLVLYGVGPEGMRLLLAVPGRWPVEGRLADQSYGLPADERLAGGRPAVSMPSSSWLAESTYVLESTLF